MNSSFSDQNRSSREDRDKQQLEKVIGAYLRGTERRIRFENEFHSEKEKQHAKNVKEHYPAAITDYLGRRTQTSSKMISYKTQQTTFNLSMDADTTAPCMEFLASYFDEKPDDLIERIRSCGEDAVENKKTLSKLSGCLVPVVLIVFAGMSSAIRETRLTMPVVILLFSLLFMGLVLFFSRRSRLSGIINAGTSASMERYCDVMSETPLQSASKPWLLVSFLAVLASAAWLIVSTRPPSLTTQIEAAFDANGYNALADSLDSILIKDGKISEKAQKALISVYDNYPEGSFNKLWTAAYAGDKVPNGFPEQTAGEMLEQQAVSLNYAAIDSSEKREALLRAFTNSGLGGDQASFAPILKQYFATGNRNDNETAGVIGERVKNWPDSTLFSEKLDLYDQFADAGFPAQSFLSAAMKDSDMSELLSMIRETDNSDSIRVWASVYGNACETLADAIPVMYTVRSKGLTLEEVFPNGIEIDLAMSLLNPEHIGDDLDSDFTGSENDHYVVISRTETDEPYEEKIIRNQIGEGYDGHDKNDPSVFRVKIESQWMDRIPIGNLPASEEECDVMIVSDMFFILDGVITRSISTGSRLATPTPLCYVPSYARVYRVLLVERETGIPIFTYDYNVLQVDEFSSSQYFFRSAEDNYLPKDDPSWAKDTFGKLLSELEESEWSVMLMLFLRYMQSL